jgi:ferric-dicitrate binding protein FerR (iron transport regulator)
MEENGFYKTIIVKFLQNNITEKELKLLNDWIAESEENKKTLNSFQLIWNASELVKGDIKINLNDEKRKLKSILSFKHSNNNGDSDKKPELLFRYLRYAAIVLISFSLSWFAYLHFSKQGQINRSYSEVIVPLGSKSHVVLPDGSNVWLNAGSRLKYLAQFTTKERSVELSGEAYFDIAKERKREFVVVTSDVRIIVHGTTFNVKAYPEESIIETTLIEGKIELRNNNIIKKGNPIIMKPEQKVSYVRNSKALLSRPDLGSSIPHTNNFYIKHNINTDVYTSWKTGELIMEDKPLAEIATILERKFDVKFIFTTEKLKHYKYSGVLKDETLQQILYVLEFTSPIKYSIHGKNVIINSPNQ